MAIYFSAIFSENIDKGKHKGDKMSTIDISSIIAAISSTASIIYLLYKEFRTKPKLKIVGIWRDPTNGSPPGIGQKNPDGTYSLSIVVEVRNDGENSLISCYGFAQTDVESRPLYDWMSYERDLGLGKLDRYGVEPYKVFDLSSHSSKSLRTGIKASSENSYIKVVVKCGKLRREKLISSITTLTFPKEPLPISAR
jgi:hypothetical protein